MGQRLKLMAAQREEYFKCLVLNFECLVFSVNFYINNVSIFQIDTSKYHYRKLFFQDGDLLVQVG